MAQSKPIAQGIDITERKLAEEALRQSEEKYRTILENMQDGYWETDLRGNFTFVNDSQCRNLGYSKKEELIGMNDRQYTDETTAKKLYEAFHGVYKTGEPVKRLDIESIKKNGKKGFSEISVSLIKDVQGKPIGFRGVTRDVTERRRAEEELRKSEEKYRTILENITEGYFENDLRGNLTFFNDSLTEVYGYTRDELLMMNYRQYMDDENARKVSRAYNNIYTTGKPDSEIQLEIIRKDGTKRYLENSVSLMRNETGQPTGFRGISRDITERKQAEEALQENEEKYRTMLENIGDSYTETDLAGRVIFFNKAVSLSLGYTEEEFVGMHYKQYTSPESIKKIYEVYNRVYKTGETAKGVELTYIAKDGSRQILESTVALMRNKSGRPIGFKTFTNNITKKRQAEEALRRSEERYRGILENMQEVYYEVDLAGNYTFINDAFSRHFGYTKEEVIGKKSLQDQNEANAKKTYHAFKELYRTGEPIKALEVELGRKDGTKGTFELSVSLIRDTQGRPIGFRGMTYDITERKRMEDELRKSEERYRGILENMQEAYYETDLVGHLAFVNDAICQHLGYSKEELIGKKSIYFQDETNAQKIAQAFVEIYRTGEPVKAVEAEYIRKDGTGGTYELSASLIRDARGKPVGFQGVSRDVTERKQMEEVIRQSEERYRTILENMQEGYFEVDFTGNFTFVNEAECKNLGYSQKEELIGMNRRQYTSEKTVGELDRIFSEVYTTGKSTQVFDVEVIKKDRTKAFNEISISVIRDAQGKPIGFGGVSRDVTERKKAEEQLKRYAAELERSNEEVKNFAYIVSHDLRVPLINLKGYTSELRSALEVIGSNFDTALPPLNDEKRSAVAAALHEDVPEALEFITNSVSRMDSFINAVLILARLGRQDLKPEPIDMNALLQTTVETMSHQLQERGIEVIVGSLPHVVADRIAMEQIVGNILSNAVKYLDSSRPGRIEMTAQANGAETTFHIRDNGRGIAAEDMDKVFAPFRRAGKQDTPGEGMGLAYVQTLLRRHGGRISCESELGKGTTFTFTISTRSEKGERDA
jgi:PAS domain S-box-containing protein